MMKTSQTWFVMCVLGIVFGAIMLAGCNSGGDSSGKTNVEGQDETPTRKGTNPETGDRG